MSARGGSGEFRLTIQWRDIGFESADRRHDINHDAGTSDVPSGQYEIKPRETWARFFFGNQARIASMEEPLPRLIIIGPRSGASIRKTLWRNASARGGLGRCLHAEARKRHSGPRLLLDAPHTLCQVSAIEAAGSPPHEHRRRMSRSESLVIFFQSSSQLLGFTATSAS